MNSKIKVSGQIISELSEKIPTNIIALNEIIKNSYDAGASCVTIDISIEKGLLTIKDDGCGMNKTDIDTLFHISTSTKIHGKINEYGRITQGSKGLGFLSVFKFGKKVEWITKKDKGYRFSVDFNTLIKLNDISQYEIELIEDSNTRKGTEIIIVLDDTIARSLKNYFSEEKYYKKVLNSFNDKNFEVNLNIGNLMLSSTKTTPFLSNAKSEQLYHIVYNSENQKLVFYYNKHKIYDKIFTFGSENYKLDMDLLIFQLKPHHKAIIDRLFINQSDDLTPLIYYNSNLFSNYNIFDPNIMKNIKTDLVLNQMIGFINIYSENSLIDFNSDRTQFLQNEVTDAIIDFLYKINRHIQEVGSEMKKHLLNFDILWTPIIPPDYYDVTDPKEFKKLIHEDFAFKDKVRVKIKENEVVYSAFGKKISLQKTIDPSETKKTSDSSAKTKNENKELPARINLNCNSEINIAIPSAQINLLNHVASVYDSSGQSVDKNYLKIKINKKLVRSNVLASQTKISEKIIEFKYNDKETGPVISIIKLNFIEPESTIVSKKHKKTLFSIPATENYIIKYDKNLGELINEINSLDINKHKYVISCSLRSIFEISIDTINKSKKYSGLYHGINDLNDKVFMTIRFIKENNHFVSAIANASGISFHTINNLLIEDDFNKAVKKSHIAVHQSTSFTGKDDIEYIIKYAGLFSLITNEMIFNDKIKR